MTIIEEQWLEVDGMRVHLYTAGEGEQTVILLHGGGTDSAWLSWQPALLALSPHCRVIAPDFPGYGKSDRLDLPYDIPYYVSFLKCLLDILGVERFSLAGISMGGGIAIGYTLAHPQQVERLVPVGSYGLAREAPGGRWSYTFIRMDWLNRLTWWLIRRSRGLARASLEQIFFNPKNISDQLMDELFAEIVHPQAGAAFRHFQRNEIEKGGLCKTVFIDRLHEIRCPVLFIHGQADRLVPLECVREAHQRAPGSRLEILPDCGHWPQRENPRLFNKVLLDFLSSMN
ncbi:MAG: alpha/beta hydrolase [Chloroflexota bacterium]